MSKKKKEQFSGFKSFGTVKALGHRKVTGLGIRFSTADKADGYGDFFTELTETGLQNGSDRPFLMEHWEDDLFAWQVVGKAIYEKQAEGWAYEATMFDSDAGNLAYDKLSGGEYRSSTGSGWNYTRGTYVDDAFMLNTWLVIEQSATLRPADFWNPPIQVKSLADYQHLSAIIAPLLAERESGLLKMKSFEEKFELLKAEVEQVKIKFDSYGERGIILPPELEEEVQSLLVEFK